MKKTTILVLIIILLCLPAVFAESSTTIKDGWIAYYSTFTSGGDEYNIRSINAHYSDPEDSLIAIRKNGELVSQVKFDQCETTIDHKYCFVDRSFDSSLIDIDSKGNLQPALKIKLVEYSYSDGLEISRTFSKNSLYLNEKAEVEMIVKNTGDYPIFDIVVNEPVPETLQIVSFDERLLRTGNNLKGTFNLYPGGEWSAKYSLRGVLYNTSETYSTSVNYLPENREEVQTKSSSSGTISVISPYNIGATISSSSIDINGKVTYTLTITNKEDVAIYARDIEVVVPSNLNRIIKSELSKENYVTYIDEESKIGVGETQTYTIEGYINYAGAYEFSYSGKVSAKGYPYSFSGSHDLEVVTDGISCSVMTNNSNIDSGESYEYAVIVNNNDDEAFYEIQGESNKGDIVYVENMPKKTKNQVINITDKAKVYFEKTANNISFNGKYRTVNNQWFDLNCEKIFNVNPAQRIVYLHLSTNKQTLNRGENISITAIVENLMDTAANNVVISTDSRTEIISIAGNSNSTLSPFVIAVPELYNKSAFNATINVEIPSNDYSDSFVVELTVDNPYVPESTSTETGNNDSSTQQDDNSQESGSDDALLITKKEKDTNNMGFFEKLKYLLKSVFGGE